MEYEVNIERAYQPIKSKDYESIKSNENALLTGVESGSGNDDASVPDGNKTENRLWLHCVWDSE